MNTPADPSPELKGLALRLRPDLAREISRLYALEGELAELRATNDRLRRQHHDATVHAGDLRQRLLTAENRLAELDVDELVQARRAAAYHGDAFVRITSRGGGRFETRLEPEPT